MPESLKVQHLEGISLPAMGKVLRRGLDEGGAGRPTEFAPRLHSERQDVP